MDHWPLHAQQWARIGPPLRPCDEDLAIVRREGAGAKRVLLLGVTPELASLPWPELVAIDHAHAMIEAVCPKHVRAIVGEWTALPLPDHAVDLVLGDGALCCVAYPDGYHAIARELTRVLAPGGRAILRLFASIDQELQIEGNFHAFKWRLAMSLAAIDRNVAVADIHRAFEARFPDRDALPWPREAIDTIDVYRDSTIRYSFPTEHEAVAALAPLRLVSRHAPAYDLGERCPTIVLAK
ncbi:MAG TPA: class I SAM-dependent methyltransferase [Kofleriaceae bacterium]|nr:class I SAM-dependent methyltransferase [Kofleriaceae bacterium]